MRPFELYLVNTRALLLARVEVEIDSYVSPSSVSTIATFLGELSIGRYRRIERNLSAIRAAVVRVESKPFSVQHGHIGGLVTANVLEADGGAGGDAWGGS